MLRDIPAYLRAETHLPLCRFSPLWPWGTCSSLLCWLLSPPETAPPCSSAPGSLEAQTPQTPQTPGGDGWTHSNTGTPSFISYHMLISNANSVKKKKRVKIKNRFLNEALNGLHFVNAQVENYCIYKRIKSNHCHSKSSVEWLQRATLTFDIREESHSPVMKIKRLDFLTYACLEETIHPIRSVFVKQKPMKLLLCGVLVLGAWTVID